MSAPEWNCVTAADGTTKVRARVTESGSITIMLTSGAMSIVASVTAEQMAFLVDPAPQAAE